MEKMTSASRFAALISLVLLLSPPALAQLGIAPITWDVVGLDSNKVNDGPDTFPIGVRITNSSLTETNTNVIVTFVWDDFVFTGVYLDGVDSKTIDTLLPEEERDIYFSVKIVRDKANFYKGRPYHVEVFSDQHLTPVRTAFNRQIYIEQLVSQKRNAVVQLIGPTEIFIGHSYTYRLIASTSTNGYEQLTAWPLFPGQAFDRVSTYFTATAPPAYVSDMIYANACIWDPNVGSPTYNSCLGTGKVGGAITVDLTVIPLIQGVYRIDQLIYDYSGSSYHYNQDFNAQTGSITVRNYDPAHIGGKVWLDNNYSGVYDAGDSGISGAQVILTEGFGTARAFGSGDDYTTYLLRTTDAQGNYMFDPLFPGDYRVTVTSVPGVNQPVTGNTGTLTFTMVEGQTVSANFGYFNVPLMVELDNLTAVTPGDGSPVQIAWETAAELDNAGFNIYRAEQRPMRHTLSPGTLLNPFMIPAQGSETEGAFYEYIDLKPYDDSAPTRVYYLEDIDLSGQSTLHGPIPIQVGKEFLRSGAPAGIPEWMFF